MYETTQYILTCLTDAIAIIGFFGIVIHAAWSGVRAEVRSWGIPQARQVQPNQENQTPIINDSWQTETAEIKLLPDPDFHTYSRNKLRQLAKSLKIKRYTQMESPELIEAIASHPLAQTVI